ncbi:glutathione S-transferase [Donghicola sp. C2-DW-16]|uniref:Glutathione S-transferase n=1 Tax=Donghicola mangrovi TaxID=2729614 RepID=A0A850Q667_9RHOB|nr:glutathione S-transferase [Donghicola mangrovi]NVO22170.1 glutathione S-transferase [Donghicola mangrovi]NVO26239.1 glutathione S-transferase [Donghicola mangrovi]
MTLFTSPTSPFVRKVRVMLHETGLLEHTTQVDVKANPLGSDPTILAVNPVGKIPALQREEGPAIYDSRVISRYLNARAGTDLYPDARIWEVLTLEASADAIMEAAVLVLYEKRLRPEPLESWVTGQQTKIFNGLDVLESRWMSHLNGPHDAGQIAVGVALGYLDFRFDSWNWRADRPALAVWADKYLQRPAMQATAPHD